MTTEEMPLGAEADCAHCGIPMILTAAGWWDVTTGAVHTCAAFREGPLPTGRRALTLTPASAIKVRPIRWLWDGRFSTGALGLVAGREGTTKSTWCYGFAARITRGEVEGVYFGIPRNVFVAASEDSWAHTIKPRLMAARADLDRVFRIDVTTSDGISGALTLPTDMDALEELLADGETGLVLLDPLLSRLDASLDTHKDAEVRRALEPITAIADRTGVFVLGLVHLNKSTSSDPLTQVMASRAFVAVPRAVLVFARDPDDESRILVGQPKNNLGRIDLPTLAYRVEEVHVADTDEGKVMAIRVVPDGESTTSIAEALDQGATGDRTATSDAAAWLWDYLEAHGGTPKAAAIREAGTKAGHSESALKRARAKLKAPFESKGYPRETWWSLPQSDQPVSSPSGESELTELTEPTDERDAVSSVRPVSSAPKEGEPTVAPNLCVDCKTPCGTALRCAPCAIKRVRWTRSTYSGPSTFSTVGPLPLRTRTISPSFELGFPSR